MTSLNLKIIAAAAMLASLPVTAVLAVEVTVDSTATAVPNSVFNTINDALDYVKTQAEPRTVDIVAGGPYNENMALNFSVTVRGQGYRPTITAPPTSGTPSASLDDNAVSFYTNADFPGDQTFRLENLIILPDVSNPPLRAIRSNNNNSAASLSTDIMNVELQDILVTSNDGADNPVTTDGLAQADLTGATAFRDDGAYFTGYADVDCTGTIVSNIFGDSAASNEGLVFFPDAPDYTLNVGPGCVFSYMNKSGLQVASDGSRLHVLGTEANPIVFKGNWVDYTSQNAALTLYADDNNLAESETILDHVLFLENHSQGLSLLYVNDGESGAKLTATNCAFVNNDNAGIAILDDIRTDWTFTNCTFANNGIGATPAFAEAIHIYEEPVQGAVTSPQADGSVTFTDCVVAGNGTAGDTSTGANLVGIKAPALNVQFINTALVTAGPQALGTDIFALFDDPSGTATPTPTETSVINDDPQFADVSSDYTNPDFLDVANTAYATAGIGGAPLSGYADYVGGSSSVHDWSVY